MAPTQFLYVLINGFVVYTGLAELAIFRLEYGGFLDFRSAIRRNCFNRQLFAAIFLSIYQILGTTIPFLYLHRSQQGKS